MFRASSKSALFLRSSKRQLQKGSRFYYQYQHGGRQLPPRSSFGKKFAYVVGGLTTVTLASYYFFWPKHTFPTSVAAILRKGLWAESDKGDKDYKLALKYYVEALQEADELKLDTLSDEYTGIQLKIAEMFERLDMIDDAVGIYHEISSNYVDALTSKRVSPSRKGHLLQKDLRVAVKITELEKFDPVFCKAFLLTHILLAEEELAKRSSTDLELLFSRKKETDENSTKSKEEEKQDFVNFAIEKSFDVKSDDYTITSLRNREAWEPFRDELFNVLHLYVALCLATGDLKLAVGTNILTIKWMLAADCKASEVLFSQCNLASLMYLNAEEYEAKEIALKKNSNSSESQIQKQLKEAVALKEQCVGLSKQSYQAVLNFSKNIPPSERHDPLISEAIALATYGLGVVNLHIGEYNKARSLLREARVRAKGSGYDDLVGEVERELGKLDKEVQRLAETNSTLSDGNPDIGINIQLHR